MEGLPPQLCFTLRRKCKFLSTKPPAATPPTVILYVCSRIPQNKCPREPLVTSIGKDGQRKYRFLQLNLLNHCILWSRIFSSPTLQACGYSQVLLFTGSIRTGCPLDTLSGRTPRRGCPRRAGIRPSPSSSPSPSWPSCRSSCASEEERNFFL